MEQQEFLAAKWMSIIGSQEHLRLQTSSRDIKGINQKGSRKVQTGMRQNPGFGVLSILCV
jgi:hypothetical protein